MTVRGNKWYRHSQSKGGAPIDFVMEFFGKSFTEAIELLTGEKGAAKDVEELLAHAEQAAKESETEPYRRFSVTETRDAFAPGEDFAVWDDIREEYYRDSDETVRTFATREESGEYLEQIEKDTDRQEAAEWAYVERAKARTEQDTSGHDVQKYFVESGRFMRIAVFSEDIYLDSHPIY